MGKMEKILIAAIVVISCAIIVISLGENKEWKRFAEDHDCKVVERINGTVKNGTGMGVLSSGNVGYGIVTTYEPSKTAFLCDDGVVYWR